MDLSSIPRFFWYCSGLAILIIASGLVFIAYRAQEVSLEFNHTKIQLSNTISEVKEAISVIEQQKTILADKQNELIEVEKTKPQATTKATMRPMKTDIQIDRVKESLNQVQQRLITKD